MNTKIYLIRHTQTVGNIENRLTGRADYEITPIGKEYINRLTERLKDIKFDKAYSSSSGRAVKTIEPLAKLNGLEIEKTDELCEMYFGIYDGWKWEDVYKVDSKIKRVQDEKKEIAGIPEQESTEEVANRMYNFIRAVSIDNEGKVILMASHGVAIEAFIKKVKNESFLIDSERNSQKNTSVNIIEYDREKDEFEVTLLNDYSHIMNIKEYER